MIERIERMDVDMVVTATEDTVSAQLRADDEEVTRVLQQCVCVCVCVCGVGIRAFRYYI